MTLSSFYGLTGCALLLVCLVSTIAGARRFKPPVRVGFFLVTLVIAFIPIDGLSLSGYVRGLTGDVSVSTWILLAACFGSQLLSTNLYDRRSLSVLLLLVLIGGFVLYPFALGSTYFDSYSFGYDSRAFLVVLSAFALWAVSHEYYLVALCVTLSVLAHSLGIMESRNLWDYLIDPWLTIYALVSVMFPASSTKAANRPFVPRWPKAH